MIAYIIAAIIIPSREIMDRAEKTYQTYTDENGESYQESYSEENDIKSTRSERKPYHLWYYSYYIWCNRVFQRLSSLDSQRINYCSNIYITGVYFIFRR